MVSDEGGQRHRLSGGTAMRQAGPLTKEKAPET
jgi:hypothetical protein